MPVTLKVVFELMFYQFLWCLLVAWSQVLPLATFLNTMGNLCGRFQTLYCTRKSHERHYKMFDIEGISTHTAPKHIK